MGEVNSSAEADLKFMLLLRHEGLPTDPVSVHFLFRLLQLHRAMGSNCCAAVQMLVQDTDICASDAAICIHSLVDDGLLKAIGDDAFRLTDNGLFAAEKARALRQRSFHEPIGEPPGTPAAQSSKWARGICLYLLIPAATGIIGIFIGTLIGS